MFKKGYIISVTSCISNGHRYETHTLNGQSYEMMIFINHLLTHFQNLSNKSLVSPSKEKDFQFGNCFLSDIDDELLLPRKYKSYEHFWEFMEYMWSSYPDEFAEFFIYSEYDEISEFTKLPSLEKCDSLHMILEDKLLGVSDTANTDNHHFRSCWRIDNYYIPDDIEKINLRKF